MSAPILAIQGRPITPEEARQAQLQAIPGAVFDVFNEALVQRAAWGAHAKPERAADVLGMLLSENQQVRCLGRTKSGMPRHPLYVRGDQPLEVFP